jgi:hypothetical protein
VSCAVHKGSLSAHKLVGLEEKGRWGEAWQQRSLRRRSWQCTCGIHTAIAQLPMNARLQTKQVILTEFFRSLREWFGERSTGGGWSPTRLAWSPG